MSDAQAAPESRFRHDGTVTARAWPGVAFVSDICAAQCIRTHEMFSAVLGPQPAALDGHAPSAPSTAVCMRTATSPNEPLGRMDSRYPEVGAVVAADVGRDGEVVGRRCEVCPRTGQNS